MIKDLTRVTFIRKFLIFPMDTVHCVRGCETVCHIAPTIKKQREMNTVALTQSESQSTTWCLGINENVV